MQSSRRVVALLVAATIVFAMVIALVVTASTPTAAPSPTATTPPSEGPVLADVPSPQGATLSGAIPVAASGVAGSTEGADPDAVVVSVYVDYLCPFCRIFEMVNEADLAELRASGAVVVEYHPIAILDDASQGSYYSTRAATAAAFVADQAPEQFVDFNTALFANQPAEGSTGLTEAQFAEIARAVGVADEVAAVIETGEYLDVFAYWVQAATYQASLDLTQLATPTVLIDGVEVDRTQYDLMAEGELARAIADAR